MKILIYSVYFAPDLTGNGKYCGDMAAWLAAHGHAVRVVAAPPYYPAWKLNSGYPAGRYRRELWKRVMVWRAPLWVPQVPGGVARILHLLSFAITSLPIMLWQVFWRPHLVMTVAPGIVCAPTGWLTARLSGARAWLHVQDFEVDVAFNLGLLKGGLLKRLILGAERWMLRRFDSVSSISTRMVAHLVEKGVSPRRAILFPNWTDVASIPSAADCREYRRQLNISANAIVLLFSGTLGAKQGVMVIPAAATLLSAREDIVFVICGDGVLRPQLETATRELPNVRLLPLQPAERFGALLNMADVHLLPQSPGAADFVLPSKLSGMLASGRPVIATCHPDTELGMVVSKCGVVVPPGDGSALADAIIRLADQGATRLELGRRAREWAELNVDREIVMRNTFGSLSAVGGRSNVAATIADDPIA